MAWVTERLENYPTLKRGQEQGVGEWQICEP